MDSLGDYKFYDRVYRLVRKALSPFVASRLKFSGEALPGGIGPRLIL